METGQRIFARVALAGASMFGILPAPALGDMPTVRVPSTASQTALPFADATPIAPPPRSPEALTRITAISLANPGSWACNAGTCPVRWGWNFWFTVTWENGQNAGDANISIIASEREVYWGTITAPRTMSVRRNGDEATTTFLAGPFTIGCFGCTGSPGSCGIGGDGSYSAFPSGSYIRASASLIGLGNTEIATSASFRAYVDCTCPSPGSLALLALAAPIVARRRRDERR